MNSDRSRLRRRLLFGSAPVVAAVLIVALKLASVAVMGNSAVSNRAGRPTPEVPSQYSGIGSTTLTVTSAKPWQIPRPPNHARSG